MASRRKDDREPQKAIRSRRVLACIEGTGGARGMQGRGQGVHGGPRRDVRRSASRPRGARGLAWAVGPKESAPSRRARGKRGGAARAVALTSEYHLGPQQRRNIVDALRRVLLQPTPPRSLPRSRFRPRARRHTHRRTLRARTGRHPQEVRRRVGHERWEPGSRSSSPTRRRSASLTSTDDQRARRRRVRARVSRSHRTHA